MKKSIITLLIAAVALVSSSCRESYDEYDEDRGATIGFTSLPFEVSLPPGGEINGFPIPYFVTSVSSSDRTFEIVIVEEESNLTSDNYEIAMEVTIPANERSGSIPFNGVNNSLGADEFQYLVLAFKATDEVTSGKTMVIGLKSNE